MSTWIEVNDAQAALRAAERFTALGDEVDDSCPAEPDWGGDEFGETLRERYPREIVAEVIAAKQAVRDHLHSSGEGVRWAVTAVTDQDQQEAGVFTNLMPPDV